MWTTQDPECGCGGSYDTASSTSVVDASSTATASNGNGERTEAMLSGGGSNAATGLSKDLAELGWRPLASKKGAKMLEKVVGEGGERLENCRQRKDGGKAGCRGEMSARANAKGNRMCASECGPGGGGKRGAKPQ